MSANATGDNEQASPDSAGAESADAVEFGFGATTFLSEEKSDPAESPAEMDKGAAASCDTDPARRDGSSEIPSDAAMSEEDAGGELTVAEPSDAAPIEAAGAEHSPEDSLEAEDSEAGDLGGAAFSPPTAAFVMLSDSEAAPVSHQATEPEGAPVSEVDGAAPEMVEIHNEFAASSDDATEGGGDPAPAAEEAKPLSAEEERALEEQRLAEEAKERDRLEREARAREAAEEEARIAAEAQAAADAAAREKAERAAFIEENSLGSLLRGARATLGKHDMKVVEREIRIKARFLHAIEALDIDNLPSEAYLPGYVRTYASHLRAALPLKPEEALAKFRVELAAKRGVPLDVTESETEEEISRRAAQALSDRVAPKISRSVIDRAKEARSEEPPRQDAKAPNSAASARPAGRVTPADALRARAEEARAAAAGSTGMGRRVASLDPMAKIERLGAEARAAAPKVSGKTAAASSEAVALRRKTALEHEAKRAAEVARASKKARAAVLRGVREQQGVDPVGPGVALATAALVIGGLSYGVWTLLTEVQKVTLDSKDDRTLTVVESLDPALVGAGVARPTASAYDPGGALTVDGESSALDGPIGGLSGGEVRNAVDEALAAAAIGAGGPEFAVHALDLSWVRITDSRGAVVFAGRLEAGAVRALDLSKGPYQIRAGNAGGVALIVDGVVRGPLGEPGKVVTIAAKDKAPLKNLDELPAATAALAQRRNADAPR